MRLPRLGQIHFVLASPYKHTKISSFWMPERGKKIYISQNSPTLGASCYALKSSNPTVESDGEILFNGLLLTANSNHQNSRYRLKSSNQETIYKIIKSWNSNTFEPSSWILENKHQLMRSAFSIHPIRSSHILYLPTKELHCAFLSVNQW